MRLRHHPRLYDLFGMSLLAAGVALALIGGEAGAAGRKAILYMAFVLAGAGASTSLYIQAERRRQARRRPS